MSTEQDTRTSAPREAGPATASRRVRALLAKHWFGLLALSLFLLSQRPALMYCWNGWVEPDGYYSHGPLVPFLVGIMAWGSMHKLRGSKRGGFCYGLPLLVLGTGLEVAAISMSWEPLCGPALILAAFGAIVCFLGMPAAKTLAFPTLFLGTMVPLPSMLLDAITSRFQLIATAIAANVLHIVDASLIRQGNILYSDALAEPLMVDKPCSGLKLLIALVTSTLFLAWIVEAPWWKRAALVVLSFPLSIAVNSLRVVMIGYVGIRTHSSEAVATFHDYSGVIGLFVCCLAVLGCAGLLRMRRRETLLPPGPETAGLQRVGKVRKSAIAALGLLCLAAVATNALDSLYTLPKGYLAREAVPAELGRWVGQDRPVAGNVREQLAKADMVDRVYVDRLNDSNVVQLLMIASLDLSAFHSPRICLPGSGVEITNETPITLEPARKGLPPIKATSLRTRSEDGQGLMFYWYQLGSETVASPSDLVAWNHVQRAEDLRQIAANPAAYSDVRGRVLSRQITLYRFYTVTTTSEPSLGQLTAFIREFLQSEATLERSRSWTGN